MVQIGVKVSYNLVGGLYISVYTKRAYLCARKIPGEWETPPIVPIIHSSNFSLPLLLFGACIKTVIQAVKTYALVSLFSM